MLVLTHQDAVPQGLARVADALGIVPHECGDPFEARRVFSTVTPLIILLPAFLNEEPTLPFMLECMDRIPEIQTIMIVERHQINEAAEAMRAGVLDCLFRPFSRKRFAKTLAAAMRRLGQQVTDEALAGAVQASSQPPEHPPARQAGQRPTENRATRRPGAPAVAVAVAVGDACLMGSQPATIALRQAIAAASEHCLPVLLRGEVGSGKSHCARLIHARSPCGGAPFFRLDCSALDPDDLADRLRNSASGTTFFLDEISDLSPQAQARLVRLIGDDEPSGARLISATAQDPFALTRDGRLRRDLFYRLCATEISVPSLRARSEDVPAIAAGVLAELAGRDKSRLVQFSASAREALRDNPWPGNMRQLINVLKALTLHHGSPDVTLVTAEMLPDAAPMPPARDGEQPAAPARTGTDLAGLFRGESLEQIERRIIEAIIRDHGNSVTRAARTLKVAPSTLYRKRENWARQDGTDRD